MANDIPVQSHISPMPPIPPGGIPPLGGPPADLLAAITSSIRRIIDAASVADLIICPLQQLVRESLA